MKQIKKVSFTLTLFIMCHTWGVLSQELDKFAQIGNKVPAVRMHLLEIPQPPVLDPIYLPIQKGAGNAFVPVDKMDTKEELGAELVKMRSHYAPFMENYAPSIEPTRNILPLSTFNWRIETDSDKANFGELLNGNGDWREVSIPHYGEPLGEATTYYYKEFELKDEMLNKDALFVRFKGVNYIAQVFMNGYYLGSHEGFFAPFEFDFTQIAKKGMNKLLVKVINHKPNADGEKIYASTGLGYDDPELGWHHCPPGMGIYQDVSIEARSRIHINDLFVRPLLEKDSAEVWIEVNNAQQNDEFIDVVYSIYGQNFKDTIYKDQVYTPSTIIVHGMGDRAIPNDGKQVELPMGYGINFLKFTVAIPNAKVWSGETPWLYQLQVKLQSKSAQLLDAGKKQFGMRSFKMDTIHSPKGAMFLNGNPIRLRGANTMGHIDGCVMRKDWNQLRDDILLAKICNMNFLRMTQRPVQSEVYDYCDMLGLLTQTDLPLFGVLRRTKFAEAIRQVEEMERLVRSHPCNIMVTYINERFPNAEGRPQRSFSEYSDYLKFFTAADQAVHIANPDRVIKSHDGDYDPPSPGLPDNHCYNLWYNGHGLGIGEMNKGYWLPVKPGWNYACGEYGSEGLDSENIMDKYYPESWLKKTAKGDWIPNNISRCQVSAFHILWYEEQYTKKDWTNASQDHQAMTTKMTTEAFRRNPRMVSSAIHLFIDAWPSGWMKTIMDVERQPKKAYFAYRDALSTEMVSIRSDRDKFFPNEKVNIELWICNDGNQLREKATLKYQIEKDNKVIFSGEKAAICPVNSSKFQGFIDWETPVVSKRTIYNVRAAIADENGKIIHDNELNIEVFPVQKNKPQKVFIVGEPDGISTQIANVLGLNKVQSEQDASLILMDGLKYNDAAIDRIETFMKEGKKLVIFNLPLGKYTIAGSVIDVTPTLSGENYFVSTQSGHPLMKDFKPGDFRFWYDDGKKIIAPILKSMLSADNWSMILKTGNAIRMNNRGSVEYKHAVMEKNWDKGKIIISQVEFNNKLKCNPVATEFLNKLMGN